jgi:hypothetical protein
LHFQQDVQDIIMAAAAISVQEDQQELEPPEDQEEWGDKEETM